MKRLGMSSYPSAIEQLVEIKKAQEELDFESARVMPLAVVEAEELRNNTSGKVGKFLGQAVVTLKYYKIPPKSNHIDKLRIFIASQALEAITENSEQIELLKAQKASIDDEIKLLSQTPIGRKVENQLEIVCTKTGGTLEPRLQVSFKIK